MRHVAILLIVMASGWLTSANAQTTMIYVDQVAGDDVNDGTDWDNAVESL